MKKNNFKLKFFLISGTVILLIAALGYFRATPNPSPEKNNSQRSEIMIEPKIFDFGEVEFGEIVEQIFEVKNNGNEILEIKRVSTSCGCTKAKIDKEKLEPNESTTLLVTYDSGAMGRTVIGKKVERFIYIRSNDPVNPQVEAVIYARVK